MKKLLVFALVIALGFVTACQNKNTDTTYNPPKEVENHTEEITLYYASTDAAYLVTEVMEVPSDKAEDPSYVLGKLLDGPSEDGLVNAITKGTNINSVKTEDGLCTVDLSAEFIEKSGTANERMAIYSVVNTLCGLDGVDKVQFLIDGKKIMIFGSYIFDEPFEADKSIVK